MTWDIPRVAVTATHNRPAELARLLRAVGPQCDLVVVIDNASSPPVDSIGVHTAATEACDGARTTLVVHDDEQPPNLSRLWNVGLDKARGHARGNQRGYDVAIFNDDAVVPPGWWDAVSGGMRTLGAAAACSDPHGVLTKPHLALEPDRDILRRMCGWAFMLRGELGMRFDERLRWWWGDSDLDWRARRSGGMLIVPGHAVGNTLANTTTVGVLAEQSGRDRQTFGEIWGWLPW